MTEDRDGHGDESVPESVSETPLSETVAPGDSGRRNRRFSDWSRTSKFGLVAFVIFVVIIIAGIVAALIPVSYYAITPGTGINVASLIAVPKNAEQTHRGSIYLTDVELVSLRALTYLYFELDHDAQVVPSQELVGSATSEQYNEQGVIDMSDARTAATVAGLRTLGYKVGTKSSGVAIYATIPNSPAAKSFSVGEIITAVNGRATLSIATLRDALQNLPPKTSVRVTTHPLGSSKTHTTPARLGTEYTEGTGSQAQVACVGSGPHRSMTPVTANGAPVSCLGIELDQQYSTTNAPFAVTIDSDGIIGPSAGLAFTLGLIQRLDHGDLTGGRRIAATGTMSINGAVGDVGGVAQKTVAVRNAGATIFFVPPQEKAVALAHAGPNLRIVAVSTLQQAVEVLERLGGTISLGSPRS